MSIPETYEDEFKRVKEEIYKMGIMCYTSEFLNELMSDLSNTCIVGRGGYGVVYRGKFPDTGEQVAIKKLKNNDIVEERVTFMAEVRTMSSTSHRNLIKLKGYCFEPNLKALVYEFMEKGSLDSILYKPSTSMEWEKLYDIAVEIAYGLKYLHEDSNEQIIHYDIKAGNVLLDNKLSPKIADFGLAKLIQRDVSGVPLSGMRGTPGYTAPELYSHGFSSEVTNKCDIYSFGMLLFEILGKRNINEPGGVFFPTEVWFSFDSGNLVDLLDKIGITKGNRENAIILSKVALLCIQYHPNDRPTIKEVCSMLDSKHVQRKPAIPNSNWKPSASSMTPSMSEYQLTDNDFNGTSSGSNERSSQDLQESISSSLKDKMPVSTVSVVQQEWQVIYQPIPMEGLDEGTKKEHTFEDGACYYGTWRNGLPHGEGKMSWTNGNKYEGEFKDGSPDGLGIFTHEDGDVYKGAFKKGNREGKEMITDGNGNKFEGDFKNGKGKGEIHFVNGNKYIGEINNDKADGHGTFVWINGDKYEGEFKNGNQEGKGEIHWANGNKYIGEFKNDEPDGHGRLVWINGDKYEGDFKNGIREGKASGHLANGDKYIGEYKNNKADGHGTFVSINGDKYEGDFKNGIKEGKGELHCANGDTYIGEYNNDKQDGHGTFVWINGDKYEGDFKNGIREGKASVHLANGDKYIGEYKNNKADGHGTFVWLNGDKYEGDFKNGMREGKGELHFANGAKHIGEFKNNRADGHGKVTYINGNKYEGDFKNDAADGRGKLTYTNGSYYEGAFKNDLQDGEGIFVEANGMWWTGKWIQGIVQWRSPYQWNQL